MSNRFLKIHPSDNVLVALADLPAGEPIALKGNSFSLPGQVPAKHKFAEHELLPDQEIRMYGVLVGKAMERIVQGGALTTKNVKHQASSYGQRAASTPWKAPDVSRWKNKTFMGYHRADGQVGVANYWLVIPLVFCENRNVDVIRDAFEEALGFGKINPFKAYVEEMVGMYRSGDVNAIAALPNSVNEHPVKARLFKNIDGVRFLTHQGGCGGIRQDAESLCALLAGYIHNPNVAGATVLSLGCQNAQQKILEEKLAKIDPNSTKKLIYLEQQKEGTEQTLLAKAIRETFLALTEINKEERKPAPVSKLIIGLKCGGSDGFSGISANPAVGHTSDLVVALGGASILCEFPELCGVEQELINRSVDDKTANNFTRLMSAYSKAAEAVGSGFDMNPSPGNIKDGLITDAMKSAGAAKKGGTSPVVDVLDYGEYVRKPGLNLLCTPGNDVESTTGMAGAGASITLFTTGLGTPTGNPISPMVKIASNTKLAQRMPDIIDINAGSVIDGKKSIEEVGEEILDYIIELASGKRTTKATELGQNDFIPWKRGVSL